MLTLTLASVLNVRPVSAKHRIQSIARPFTLGGHVWVFGCRCGHETKGYVRPLDALGMIEAHMRVEDGRGEDERREGREGRGELPAGPEED